MGYLVTRSVRAVTTKGAGSSPVYTPWINIGSLGAEFLSVTIVGATEPWNAAVWTLEGSSNRSAAHALPAAISPGGLTITGAGSLSSIDVRGLAYVRLKLTNPEASAGGKVDAIFALRRNTSPFDQNVADEDVKGVVAASDQTVTLPGGGGGGGDGPLGGGLLSLG